MKNIKEKENENIRIEEKILSFDSMNDILQDNISNNLKREDSIVSFTEQGSNLYIGSVNLQTGKTTWSLKLLYKYFDEIWAGNGFRTRGYFIHVPEFLGKLKDFSFRETAEYKRIDKCLKTCDLVIWDDITSQPLTPNEQNILNVYIDKRLMEDRANIFNGMYYKGEKLEQVVGNKLASRLSESEVIVLKGKSVK